MNRALIAVVATTFAIAGDARAAEICGNQIDDDDPAHPRATDEGCDATRTNVCMSPLSCLEGWVGWDSGALHYDLPADVAPASPYGPAIGLRRFYTSTYAPTGVSAVNRTPLGPRWQHNYLTWVATTSDPKALVIHTPAGQDLLVRTVAESDATVRAFLPQKGQHFLSFTQRPRPGTGATEYELRLLSGDTLLYDAGGKLIEIWDRVAAPNTNKVTVAWTTTTAGLAVGTVTDATGVRRLRFNYTGAVLGSVDYQLYSTTNPASTGTWTTHHTTTYGYAGGMQTNVLMKSSATATHQLVYSNVYSNGKLAQINDGDGRRVAAFAYNANAAARIDTPDGTVGFEYGTTRAACVASSPAGSSQTVLYFHQASETTSCSADADCGADAWCGGKTGAGATGRCFQAARCMTVESKEGEPLVTSVKSLGTPATCTGACAEVTRYLWNAALDLQATQEAGGAFTTMRYDEHGRPTKIVTADTDDDPTNASGARTTYVFYNLDGQVREVRRLSPTAARLYGNWARCGDADPIAAGDYCTRTRYLYDPASGAVARVIEGGFTLDTLDDDDMLAPYEHVTTLRYDTRGRLVEVDGPGTDVNDVTTYGYVATTDPTSNGFVSFVRRRRDAGLVDLERTLARYDVWGHPIEIVDGLASIAGPSARTTTCEAYDSVRNYLTKHSVEMTATASCAADDPSDLIERYERDTGLRLVRVRSADGSCTHWDYDERGRLVQTKRRDDCNPASPGERTEYRYDADGLVTEVLTYDAAGVLARKQQLAYADSRRLLAVLDPVDSTRTTTFGYDERGELTGVTAPGGLGSTEIDIGADHLVTAIRRALSATVKVPWLFARDADGRPIEIEDPDHVKFQTTYDDRGQIIRIAGPGQPLTRVTYTPAGRVATWRTGGEILYNSHDALGRPLTIDYPGGCNLAPEISHVYDIPPATCPVADGCTHVAGRLAYTRVTLMCVTATPSGPLADGTLDRETFYAYDRAGRLVAEHIRDDSDPTRVVDQRYTWSASGDLASATMPSGATIGWTVGGASNDDADRISAVWRGSPATPIVDAVAWAPDGPLRQYERKDTISGAALRMRYSYDLAYRPTAIDLESQAGAGPYYRLTVTRDAKGRVIGRDLYPSGSQLAGITDSYYLYDALDRVRCETSVAVASCPPAGDATLKNAVDYSDAGDRTSVRRPITTATVTSVGHVLASVDTQLGATHYTYDARGRRVREDNPAVPYDERRYTYDVRGNLAVVTGTAPVLVGNDTEWHPYVVRSAFDARNRRVFKSYEDTTTHVQQQWFFSYDALDRLTEVRYIPSAGSTATYTIYQLVWLDQLLVAYWQTDYPSGTTTKRYVETDETGRPVRMHGWVQGNSPVVWAIDPDAWGNDEFARIGWDVFQPIVFAGQYRDAETTSYTSEDPNPSIPQRAALVLNGHRTYDPFTGGYLQLDPLVQSTLAPYGYAGNDPVNRVDPSGLKDEIVVKGETFYIRDPWQVLTEPLSLLLGDPADLAGSTSGGLTTGGTKPSRQRRPKPDKDGPPKVPKPQGFDDNPRTTSCADDLAFVYTRGLDRVPYFKFRQGEVEAVQNRPLKDFDYYRNFREPTDYVRSKWRPASAIREEALCKAAKEARMAIVVSTGYWQ